MLIVICHYIVKFNSTLPYIKMSKLNYISENLKKSAINVYNELEPNYKKELNTIVDNIFNLFDGYFDDIKKENKLIYTLVESKSTKIYDMDGIDTSNIILNKLNRIRIYDLIFNMNKIKITIYHEDIKDNTVLDQNIYNIMKRLINLFTLYQYKKNDTYDLLNYEYIFYLYSNPRTSNRNKSGKQYIDSLYNSKNRCFNASSGVTIPGEMILKVSRTEDFLGLLTHEILHACGIININKQFTIHNIEIKLTEAFVNMLAAIINVYLTCYENETPELIKQYLLIELIHSINHMVKYSIIQGYDINTILDMKQDIMLSQKACMFEYIVGKMILFMNFDKICKIKEFSQKLFSLTVPWDEFSLDNIIIDKFLILYKTSNIIKVINIIHTNYLNDYEESKSICGNMLMSYYAIDMMVLGKQIINLYGGSNMDSNVNDIQNNYIQNNYIKKYMKYKTKYLILKKFI